MDKQRLKQKLSKQKQKLSIKFLKDKSIQNKQIQKNYKRLFEKLHKQAKQIYYQCLLKDCQNVMKGTLKIMKKSQEKVNLILTDFLNQ